MRGVPCWLRGHTYLGMAAFTLQTPGPEIGLRVDVCIRCYRARLTMIPPTSLGGVLEFALRFEQAARHGRCLGDSE